MRNYDKDTKFIINIMIPKILCHINMEHFSYSKKLNIQYISNGQMEFEIKITLPLTLAPPRLNYKPKKDVKALHEEN